MSSNKRKSHARQKPLAKRSPVLPLLLLLAGLILVAGAFFAFNQSNKKGNNPSSQAGGEPSLNVDQEKIDLGDVTLGEWVSASFLVSNAGDQPLKILKDPYIEVAAGC